MYNPSLRRTPRHEPADVIPLKQETSILEWLQSTGRLLARDAHDPDFIIDEEEISELMSVEDSGYEDDDDDDAELD